jgi:hypothetical protein
VGSNPISSTIFQKGGPRACIVGATLRSGKEKIRFVWLLRRIAVREILVDGG